MAKVRQVAVNNNAGTFTDILASIPCSRMELMEDEGAATQGLQVKSLLDNFATTNVFSFGSEPVVIESIPTITNGSRPKIGYPAQPGLLNLTATKIASVRSNGAAGTTVRVVEYE